MKYQLLTDFITVLQIYKIFMSENYKKKKKM